MVGKRFQRAWPYATAFLIGALATSVGVGLSLQLLPFAGPALLYGVISAVFAYMRPEPSWRWGLWTTAGMLFAMLLVAALMAVGPLAWAPELPLQGGLNFLSVNLVFGLVPAIIGGCVGAYLAARVKIGKLSC